MILNVERTINKIVIWLQEYVNNSGKKLFITEIQEPKNLAQWLTVLLCIQARTNVICLVPELDSLNFKTLHTFSNKVQFLTVPLPNVLSSIQEKINKKHLEPYYLNNMILRIIAASHDGLIIDWLPREWCKTRAYTKNCYGDLFPLANLYYSEIKQLFDYIAPEVLKESIDLTGNLSPREFACKDIEWACREEELTGVISSNKDPAKSREWARYTVNQRQIIAKLNQYEKLTRHKDFDFPMCKIREIPGLTR